MKKVLVYGLKDPVGGVERVIFEYVRAITEIRKDISFDFLIFSESFSMEDDIRKSGCNVIYVPSRKENFSLYKKKIESVFSENQYCAVWGNYSGLTNIDLLTLAKKHKIPVRIAHSHVAALSWGSSFMKYVVTILHSLNKFRLPLYATHYWGCSLLACNFMFPASQKNKFSVVKNAVDPNVFRPDKEKGLKIREEYNIPRDAVVVGHVARMCKEKNQMFLLSVFSELLKISPEAVLLFVGDGELREQIFEHTKALGIEKNVIFTGHKENVSDYLCAANVFLLPSLAEGLGLCAVEAQATGVPCVVSDVVPRDIDITGTTQFCSLTESPGKWAELLLACSKISVPYPTETVKRSGYEITEQAEKIYSVFEGR